MVPYTCTKLDWNLVQGRMIVFEDCQADTLTTAGHSMVSLLLKEKLEEISVNKHLEKDFYLCKSFWPSKILYSWPVTALESTSVLPDLFSSDFAN